MKNGPFNVVGNGERDIQKILESIKDYTSSAAIRNAAGTCRRNLK